MRALLRTGVIAVPVLAALLALRSCQGGEGGRWLDRVAAVDPAARLAVDGEDLVVLAPDVEEGRRAGAEVVRFRRRLIDGYADLLGRGRDQRVVVVVFSSVEALRAFRARGEVAVAGLEETYGYTAPDRGAIFVPRTSPDTLRHETVHLVMAEGSPAGPEPSPWLLEGLAQLFETDPPGIDPERRALLARLSPEGVDVDRLLALQDYEEFVGRDGPRNYLEALALTAFLFRERPRESLARYIREDRASASGRPLRFRRIYSDDGPEFRRDLARFLGR
jgi:hypothetical protein